MATIFTVNYDGGYGNKYQFKVDAIESDKDIAKNTSKVTAKAYLRRIDNSANGAWNNYGTPWSITIAGEKFTGNSTWSTRNTTAWQLLGTATKTITHDSNGDKTITISGTHTGNSASGSSRMGNASGSGTFKLSKIPRYATLTQKLSSKTIDSIKINWSSDSTIDYVWYSANYGTTWHSVGAVNAKSGSYTITGLTPNTKYGIKTRVRRKDSQLNTDSSSLAVTTYDIAKITSAPNFNDEANPTIKYNNPFGSSVTSLEACISLTGSKDDIKYRAIEKTNTSYTFNLTNSERDLLRKQIPKANSLKVKFYIKTVYNGKTYYNSIQKTMTIINANPIFENFEYEDTNEYVNNLTGDNSIFIKKYSNLKVTIPNNMKMEAQKFATPINYNIIADNKSITVPYSSTEDVIGTIDNMESSIINVYAVDSRNNQSVVSKSVAAYDYKECVLESFSAERVDGIGNKIKIFAEGKYDTINFGAVENSIIDIRYRKKINEGYSSWTGWNSIPGLFNVENGKIKNIDNNILDSDDFAFGYEYLIELEIEDELSTYSRQITLNSGKVLMSALKGCGVCFGGIYDKDVGGPLQVEGRDVSKLVVDLDVLPEASEEYRNVIVRYNEALYVVRGSVEEKTIYDFKVGDDLSGWTLNMNLNTYLYSLSEAEVQTGGTFNYLETTTSGISYYKGSGYNNSMLTIGLGTHGLFADAYLYSADYNAGEVYTNLSTYKLPDTFGKITSLEYPVSLEEDPVHYMSHAIWKYFCDNTTLTKGSYSWVEVTTSSSTGFRVGDVIITSTNTNPANYSGGTWKLIDKEFKYSVETLTEGTHYTINNTNCNEATIVMERAGHNVWLRINIKNKVAIGDTEVIMLTFNYSKMGFKNLSHSIVNDVGASDGANAIIIYGLNYSTGEFKIGNAIVKGSTSSMAANSQLYFHTTQNINPNVMNDSVCDKFYWQKIS